MRLLMDRMQIDCGLHGRSVQTSAHVHFIEVDDIVKWRENKLAFEKREGEKLTYTQFSWKQSAKSLKDFPD
jgi:2-oxoglutarate dehydrogenase E2 component (dihydrolipoamide succinyltransferase)